MILVLRRFLCWVTCLTYQSLRHHLIFRTLHLSPSLVLLVLRLTVLRLLNLTFPDQVSMLMLTVLNVQHGPIRVNRWLPTHSLSYQLVVVLVITSSMMDIHSLCLCSLSSVETVLLYSQVDMLH